MLGNGCFVAITISGSILLHVTSYFCYEHIVACWPLTKNLISVKQLYHDNNITMAFFPNYFYIEDFSMKNFILEGDIDDGLYKLPTLSQATSSSQVSNIASSNISFTFASTIHNAKGSLWHNHLNIIIKMF